MEHLLDTLTKVAALAVSLITIKDWLDKRNT